VVHYTGTLEDGTKFDSSRDRKQPSLIKLGRTGNQRLGRRNQHHESWWASPVNYSDLGYGARGAGGVIPPNATLIFDVELLKIE